MLLLEEPISTYLKFVSVYVSALPISALVVGTYSKLDWIYIHVLIEDMYSFTPIYVCTYFKFKLDEDVHTYRIILYTIYLSRFYLLLTLWLAPSKSAGARITSLIDGPFCKNKYFPVPSELNSVWVLPPLQIRSGLIKYAVVKYASSPKGASSLYLHIFKSKCV